jgi:predicted membrane protein
MILYFLFIALSLVDASKFKQNINSSKLYQLPFFHYNNKRNANICLIRLNERKLQLFWLNFFMNASIILLVTSLILFASTYYFNLNNLNKYHAENLILNNELETIKLKMNYFENSANHSTI